MHRNLNQDLMGFFYDDVVHVLLTTKWPHKQTPPSSISTYQWWLDYKRRSWFHQINTFHSRLEPRGWIINHHICCWLCPLPTTSLYRLNHFCLFTISSVAMFVWVSELKNLVILLPAPRQQPKGFNTLSSHSKNSLKQCWALDWVHSGHLQTAVHQELRLV